MHFNFVKGPKGDKVRFFQSSFPYLNNNAVSLYKSGRTKKWTSEEPQPSAQRILTFSNGHYGIYFTIFNHELRREERTNLHDSTHPLIVMVVPNSPQMLFLPEFFISKAKQDIQNVITELKSVSKDLLSTSSLVNPRRSFRHAYMSKRGFTTSARALDRDETKQPQEFQQTFIANEPANEVLDSKPLDKIEELPDNYEVEHLRENIEEPFESSFQRSQVNRIVTTYAAHSKPSDLDIIHPIYQSLKRNGILLPSVHEYNIVLESIALRSLDSEPTLEAIESRLTSLLTVYQDVLLACSKSVKCRPNSETFNIVLNEIFRGAVATTDLCSSSKISNDTYQAAFFKSEEFCQVGINLFMSVQDQDELDLKSILPNLIAAVNSHPNLLLKKLAACLIDVHNVDCLQGPYYVGLINLSRYLQVLEVMNNKEDVYKFITSVFENFKSQTTKHPDLLQYEYSVYSSLVQALIHNGNLALATQFLDSVLVDYKASIASMADKSIVQQKKNVSNLLSDYLQAISSSGQSADLNRTYNLLEKFREVSYIPELNVQVYNEMINKFINEFTLCEVERSQGNQEVEERQRVLYNKIWELYDRAAIRKDFQTGPIVNSKTQNFGSQVNCRDYLLSLSLDLSDHPQITRLIKEILLKSHKITDWNVSKKLCLYLYNGVAAYGNDYYTNLLWSVLEQQADCYADNSKALNNFLSEHISFLLFETPENFDRILDSHMIYNAFSNVSVKEDNIHGVVSIAAFLMFKMPSQLSTSQYFKLMQFQSFLINEFEDPENHYLQLSPEMEQFKQTLYQLFTNIRSANPAMRVTNDINEACKALGLSNESFTPNEHKIAENDFQKDLSALFAVNYSVAVTTFLESFKSGFKFNEATWRAIISQNFALDTLEKDSLISIQDFVDRILKLGLGSETEKSLISSLIGLDNEKINIEAFKYLVESQQEVLFLDEVLKSLMEFGAISENKYFLRLVAGNLEKLVSVNYNRIWLTKCLDWFTSIGQTIEATPILEAQNLKLIFGLNISNAADEEFLAAVLMALSDLSKGDEINKIFGHYFSGKEGTKALLQSKILLSCLLNHYIAIGAYEEVLAKFAPFQDRSAEIKQLVQFAQLMSGLNGDANKVEVKHYKDANNVGLAILNEKDPLEMKKIYETNRRLVQDREEFFDFMVSCLSKASSLSGNAHTTEITSKLQSIVKFCRVLRMNQIGVDSLINIIELLKLLKARSTLNILANKFVDGASVAPFVNFYFLLVDVRNKDDAARLLNALKVALYEVGDELNGDMITEQERLMT